MGNVEKTIISQYANSPIITQMIQDMDAYIDPSADIDNFYNLVWNVDTAVGFGLDIWGRIVGVSRDVALSSSVDKYFGFSQAVPGAYPFGEGVFYNGGSFPQGTVSLPDSSFKMLILAKALTNISAATFPAINRVLMNMFGSTGRCFCRKSGTMSIEYVFESSLSEFDLALVAQTGAFLRPAGVMVTVTDNALKYDGTSVYDGTQTYSGVKV